MQKLNCPISNKKIILALGPESSGNFALYKKGTIYLSPDFGDLLDENNWQKYKKTLFRFLKIKPNIILTDLHPLYKTTELGQELAEKYKAKHIQIQHHSAHIFSCLGDHLLDSKINKLDQAFFGIACDGTGYGLDGKIWGGEIFEFKVGQKFCPVGVSRRGLRRREKPKLQIKRIGHLENQTLIGADLAIREPARMLISILFKILVEQKIYSIVKKYYTKNQFEVLRNQLKQNFNCQQTSSTGRILDAVSILLGFCGNKRKYKHEPINLLEKNSSLPYKLTPKIRYDKQEKKYILLTTPLFAYLLRNINKDKKRLAATAQLYIAQGLYKVIKKYRTSLRSDFKTRLNTYFAGGMANNKIMSAYLGQKEVIINKTIPPGDAGLSFGQVIYYLLTNSRN